MRPLEQELRALRPEPEPAFAAALDRRAAAGFPREDRLAGVRHRLAGLSARRVLAPAAAAATLALVVGVALTQVELGDSGPTRQGAGAPEELPPASGALEKPANPETLRDEALGARSFSQADEAGAGVAGPASEVPLDRRKVAQDVTLAIATAPAELRDAADAVLDVVRESHGFILRSSVSTGDPDMPVPVPAEDAQAGGIATFDLRIPAGELEDTLASLSDLGHVVSRSDGKVDITSRFTSARGRIASLRDQRDTLLEQLAAATTPAERESIEQRLAIVRASLGDAKEELEDARRRVQLVPVALTISADASIDDEGDWAIGDALDDAGRALEVIAGVLLISLAILIPLAALAALAWAIRRAVVTRRRERALDA